MSRISELPKAALVGGIVALALLATAALYFTFYKPFDERSQSERQRLAARRAEVQNLKRYENDLPRLNQQIALLREQLEIQKRILPEEKEAPGFLHMLQHTAQSAGVEIRRWTAKPVNARDYYTEVPFELELDGSYYGVLNFFQRVGQLERIINVAGLQLNGLKDEEAKSHRSYVYGPRESVAGICTASTFYSPDPALAPKPAPPKAGAK
jgi:type IV pilus assembly protein PilO